jgi:SAM-dependent methyltransferase
MNMEQTQAALWNGPAGESWVESQALLDGMLAPFCDLLMEAVPEQGDLLDIGCGTGATTLAAARRLGGKGRCTGIDISEPMLALARRRGAQEGAGVEFIGADAQTYPFAPARFDALISRFGVMFFADPVRAFANLHRAARPGARLRFAAWRGPAENPFMTAAERAAAPLLPELPARQPGGPGQFGFADAGRIRAVLEDSGWHGAGINAVDVECCIPAAALDHYAAKMGPVGQALQKADGETRQRVLQAVRRAFAPYVRGEDAVFVAACWIVDARA